MKNWEGQQPNILDFVLVNDENLVSYIVHLCSLEKRDHEVLKETVVERLAHWTPDQKVPGSNPAGGLNFRVSESALSTAP